jgi:uncharacterized protein affecting Mg2+/Co2+ transport
MTVTKDEYAPRRADPGTEIEFTVGDELRTLKAEEHPELGSNYWTVTPRDGREDTVLDGMGLPRAQKALESSEQAKATSRAAAKEK